MKRAPRFVSIILPTYNEVDNIVPLIAAVDRVVQYPKEIIVVDDNSPDGTSALVSLYIKRSKKRFVRLETRYRNRGLTNSIRRGTELARGDVVVWMDCDFSHPPAVIQTLLRGITKGYDIVVASRFVPGGKVKAQSRQDSLVGIVLSRALNAFMQLLLGIKFYDYTSGFVAVRKNVFRTITLRGDYGEYFIDFIVRAIAQRYRVLEVPYVSASRRAGVSKTGQNIIDYSIRGRKYLSTLVGLLIKKHFAHTL